MWRTSLSANFLAATDENTFKENCQKHKKMHFLIMITVCLAFVIFVASFEQI